MGGKMLALHQTATDIVSRVVAHTDIVGNPMGVEKTICVIPVANFNFSEITLYTVEIKKGRPTITRQERVVEREKINTIKLEAFNREGH
ncbi:MAG: hypothetical protein PHH83_02230 [Patescibacteria group bacterium]|nr:hypothetical protein [Patescibacteria group bacterium]